MNDREFDELLDVWVAPPVPPMSLALAPVQKRTQSVWWAVSGLAALLLMVGLAFSQIVTPMVVPRFTVESEVVRYAADGSSRVERYTTSFLQHKRTSQITTSAPGQPFLTAVRWIASDVAVVLIRGVAGAFVQSESKVDREDWCRELPGLKRETVLGYETVLIPWPPGNRLRLTEWRAPDLGCIPLKSTTEVDEGSGRFRLTSETWPIRLNRR